MTNDSVSRFGQPLSMNASRAEIDAGLRQFMLSVYNYMGSGLALTGVVAYGAAESGLYASLVRVPLLFWVIVLAPLVLVFFLSFRIEKISLAAAQAAFWAYAALIGLSLSGILDRACLQQLFKLAVGDCLGMLRGHPIALEQEHGCHRQDGVPKIDRLPDSRPIIWN